MAPNLALAQRQLIENAIYAKEHGDDAPDDKPLSKIAKTTPRTISRHRLNFRCFGTTRAPSNGVGRPRTITPNMMTALCDKLARKPCMRQKDMVKFLQTEFDVNVTRFSVSRALEDIDYTRKVTRNVAKERNPYLRAEHIHERAFLDSRMMVFVDESGCDTGIGIKNKGWAKRGVTPVQIKRFHRGRRFQILPAYTQDGVLYHEIYDGATDSEIFEGFIKRLLPHCGKFPEPSSVLIMDNATIHHSEMVKQLCDDAGVVLLYLPPYSPDLNPIEEFFGELKNYIREIWDEQEDLIRADFRAFLQEAVRVVGRRKESAKGHFRHAGISVNGSQ